jgi:pimeloyl-ACP methyl ester carboxylesterase
MQRRIAQASHAGQHVIAARSSHWVQLDEPELVSAAVQQLVRQIRR